MLYKLKQISRKVPVLSHFVLKRSERINANFEYNARVRLQAVGYDVADEFICAMDDLNLGLFVDYGTLLGFVRDGGFIAHDDDLDFGFINRADDQTIWFEIEEHAKRAGFRKIRQFSYNGLISEQAYEYKGLTLDIFSHSVVADGKMSALSYEIHDDVTYRDEHERTVIQYLTCTVEEIDVLSVHGKDYPVPRNATRYLCDVYGEPWHQPLLRGEYEHDADVSMRVAMPNMGFCEWAK